MNTKQRLNAVDVAEFVPSRTTFQDARNGLIPDGGAGEPTAAYDDAVAPNTFHSPQSFYPEYSSMDWVQLSCGPESLIGFSVDGMPTISSHPQMVSAVAFDRFQELLWAGNSRGHLRSFFPHGMHAERYTSFPVVEGPVQVVRSVPFAIVSAGGDSFRVHTRGGMSEVSLTSLGMENICCMELPSDNYAVVGGKAERLLLIDLHGGRVISRISSEHGTSAMKASGRFLCCGTVDGKVVARDPRFPERYGQSGGAFGVVGAFDAHQAGVEDVDVHGHHVITSGWSLRRGNSVPDPFVRLFDLRYVRSPSSTVTATPVLTVSAADPFACRYVPLHSGASMLVASRLGRCDVYDVRGSGALLNQSFSLATEGDNVCSFDFSSSGSFCAFGDTGGGVHVWTLAHFMMDGLENARVNGVLNETLFPTIERLPPSWNGPDDEGFVIPDVCRPPDAPLLSDWPPMTFRARLNTAVPGEVLATMRLVDFVGYAAKPRSGRSMTPRSDDGSGSGIMSGRTDGSSERTPPNPWTRVSVTPGRTSELEEAVRAMNKTSLCGLENTLPNTYTNPVLQVLYFIPALRAAMLNHLCQSHLCFACELGFLFHLLSSAKGATQSTNFLRAFRHVPEASALGLVEEAPVGSGGSRLPLMVEAFNRFLLEALHRTPMASSASSAHPPPSAASTKSGPSSSSPSSSFIGKLFGAQVCKRGKCSACQKSSMQRVLAFQFKMSYPVLRQKESIRSFTKRPFSDLLKATFVQETHPKTWCAHCEKYQATDETKTVVSLPNILCLGCSIQIASELEIWRSQCALTREWVPEQLLISSRRTPKDSDEVSVSVCESNPAEEELEKENGATSTITYRLHAVVCHVHNAAASERSQQDSLCVGVRVREAGEDGWFLINDFCIAKVPYAEIVDFSVPWKTPCLFYFARSDVSERIPVAPIISPIGDTFLLSSNALATGNTPVNRRRGPRSFTPLASWELPLSGALFALDAEFYLETGEFFEMREDGTEERTKRSAMGLGRVSVVRGGGEGGGEGVPLIDDHISTLQPVVDYLTQFSGLRPGDLDPSVSRHHVISLKTVYLKVRRLLERGAILIGHGLTQDFRTINIYVPPDQVIDTVEIFHVEGRRLISLRFLVAYLFSASIQSDEHDSIEDACSALSVYKRYLELVEAGTFDETLRDIYRVGRICNWQVGELPKQVNRPKSSESPDLVKYASPLLAAQLGSLSLS